MKPTRNQLVAVVGGSGAGKTWLVEQICRILGDDACRISLDDFYRDRSHLPFSRRAQLNYDTPAAIDWDEAQRVLAACRAGAATAVPAYDFATYSRHAAWRPWRAKPLVFVDGLWLLRSPEVRSLFDLSIFLDTPATLRQERRVTRDALERGYSPEETRARLANAVLPMHRKYVEPQRRWADIILSQPYCEPEVELLADRLWGLCTASGAFPCWMRETFRAELLSLLVHEHEYAN
jgi:uridine kinase